MSEEEEEEDEDEEVWASEESYQTRYGMGQDASPEVQEALLDALCQLAQLQDLALLNWRFVLGAGALERLGGALPQLRALDVDGCDAEHLTAIARGFRALRCLRAEPRNVTPQDVTTLASMAPARMTDIVLRSNDCHDWRSLCKKLDGRVVRGRQLTRTPDDSLCFW